MGAGRKPRFHEPTIPVSFRVPVSKVEDLRKLVLVKLEEWANEKD